MKVEITRDRGSITDLALELRAKSKEDKKIVEDLGKFFRKIENKAVIGIATRDGNNSFISFHINAKG